MGCSGCGKARAAMQARLQAQKPVQPIAKYSVSPIVPSVQKTPRQLRIEARAARIAARNARIVARNAAFLAQKKVG